MKLPIKTLLCGWDNETYIFAKLQVEKVVDIVDVLPWAPSEEHNVSMHEIVCDAIIGYENNFEIPLFLYEKLFKDNFHVFYASISRFDSYWGDHTTYPDAMYLFRRIACFVYDLIVSKSVELIVFQYAPHFLADVLLEAMGRALGIKILFFITPSYTNTFFFSISSINEYGLFKDKPVRRIISEEEIKDFLSRNTTQCKALSWKKDLRAFRNIKIKAALSHDYLRAYNLYLLDQYLYNQFNTHMQDELPKDYIYFPLHYQPEASTIIQNDIIYSDQVLAIEMLAQKLPDGFVIVIKEQPMQLYNYRSTRFYKALSKIPQVRFTDLSADSHMLIQNAHIVATVSGTAGWEALKSNKPVIYFGYPTYREMPGAFQFTQEMDINKVLTNSVMPEELERSIGEMLSTTFEGAVGEIPADDKEANCAKCVVSIKCILDDFESRNPSYRNIVQQSLQEHKDKYLKRVIKLPPDISPLTRNKSYKSSHSACKIKILKFLNSVEKRINKVRLFLINKDIFD